MTDSRKTSLYENHKKLGAKLIPFSGFLMPLQYSSIIDEHKHVRSMAGIFDVSHMGEFIVKGKNARQFLQKVTTNDIDLLEVGKAQYSAICNEDGGIIDDLLIYNLSDYYMLVVNAANIDKDFNWLQSNLMNDVKLENVSDNMGLLAVQGPISKDILLPLYPDIDSLNYYETLLPDSNGIIVARTGYSGELGYEIYCPNDKIVALWEELLFLKDLMPVGLGCRDSLRLEMGYSLYGHELDESTNPIEAGLSWITKLKTNFIGSARMNSAIERKLVPLLLKDRAIPRSGYKIFNDKDKEIGFVTSGGMSPSLSCGIALAYIDLPFAEQLECFKIKIRDNFFDIYKTKLPFYKKGTYLA
ncbi:MAG: glycine cleavage system aminomethyltransferase GcvT [Candidatus Neomarinimicrobiota bacterium]|nr:glycine cleavage system aminomethyltransferase GcvT [Candidatus Neomarinimicrobiota bacterium]